MQNNKKKIYIAGFDVFYLDALKRGEYLKTTCDKYGFIGLYPMDNEINDIKDKEILAQTIFKGNVDLIKESDIIVANLNKFRGEEPDSGTCFECGLGYGLGKMLFGYIDDISPLRNKFKYSKYNNGLYLDENDMIIENFDLPINLMLGCSMIIIEGNFENCIKEIYSIFK